MSTITVGPQQQTVASYTLKVSHHAFQRARQRLHWSRQTIGRMAERALSIGLSASDCTGALKHALIGRGGIDHASSPYLYGEHIYIFGINPPENEVELITVYRAEPELLRVLVSASQQRGDYSSFGNN
jgi:hypothetical protein